MGIYEENISFLTERFPQLLTLIRSASTDSCRIEPAKNGSPTLVYIKDGTSYYLHSRFDPEGESTKILQKKNLSADHLVVLGLGLGYHLETIMAQKDRLSRVLLIEPELTIVGYSLHTLRWRKLLTCRDFFYVLGPDLDLLAETIHRFISIANFETLESIELPSETRLMQPFFSRAQETIQTEIKTGIYDFKTRLAESVMVPRNILQNLPWILKTRPVAQLQNAFPGVPGFIVSAGPSLDKNVLYLEKIKDRAILIAVDTALKPLLKRSIHPHFTVAGDPSYKNYLHLQGTEDRLRHFLLVETGIAHRVFRDFHDRIFTLSIGKPIVGLLERHSEPLGDIEGWGSVISIALNAAVYMGLNPIIFIGQDFSFTDSRNHCRGTTWEDDRMASAQSLDDIQRFERTSIGGDKKVMETVDIFGNTIHTSERLVLYKNFLARLVNRYAQHTPIRFWNASQGGIFSEIPYIPLVEAIQTFVYGRQPLDFNALYHLPTLNKKHNVDRLRSFLKETAAAFTAYLQTIDEALATIQTHADSPMEQTFPLIQRLESIQQEIYGNAQHGDILEMWSSAPIFYFIKSSKRIRDHELNASTIREGIDIYKTYFLNIKPLVEDIIKQFGQTSGELETLNNDERNG
ncbi:MAG: motility associated factor glycosyltransferase family protein [Candidatus Omnitrophota bacterium]